MRKELEMEGIYFVLGLIVLITYIVICNIFSQIAEAKGFRKIQYFVICFLGGIMGALLIIALPDTDKYKSDTMVSSNSKKMLEEIEEIKSQIAKIADR